MTKIRSADHPSRTEAVGDVIVNLLPFLLLIGFWMLLMRRMRSGAGVPNPTVDKLE